MKNTLLERRIARLEKLISLTNEMKFEDRLNVVAARKAANKIAQQLSQMLDTPVSPDDLGDDVISSPIYGWLTVNDVDEIKSDPDAQFAFQYKVAGLTAIIIPEYDEVELLTKDGLAIDPFDGYTFEADCPQDGSFKIYEWRKFDLAMVNESCKRRHIHKNRH